MTMERPVISILTPVHNNAASLRGAVESALFASKDCKLEIVLAENGSNDDSLRLCHALADEYPEVRAYKVQEVGVSRARNLALQKATGDYLSFLDADDRLAPGSLDLLFRLLAETGADVAGGGLVRGTSYENWEAAFAEAGAAVGTPWEEVSGAEYVRKGLIRQDTSVCTKLFSRNAVGELRFPTELTVGEDMLFLLRALLQPGIRYVRTQKPFYYYYWNTQSAMNQKYAHSYLDQIRCWEKAEAFLRENCPEVLAEEAVSTGLHSIQAVSALLVADKLAGLSAKEREAVADDWSLVRRFVQERLQDGRVKASLAPPHRVRAVLLQHFPKLYMRVFGR